MYHRIASLRHDPWGLAVSAANFSDQLFWLSREREVLGMAEFVGRLRSGRLADDAVAITFDDGYEDNLAAAQVLLDEYSLPATLFAVQAAVMNQMGFWWDQLAAMTISNADAARGSIVIGRERVEFAWSYDSDPGPPYGWRAFDRTEDPRALAYQAIWRELQPLADLDREAALVDLAGQTGKGAPLDGRAMTQRELGELVARRRFALGGHSVTHAALRTLDDLRLRRDLAESFQFVQSSSLKESLPGFAYPYGDVDERVRSAVVDAGFAWACTTRSSAVTRQDDLFMLPRLMVPDKPAVGLAQTLKAASSGL
jgi:peptidoglycan/xylan/chitin deacetylase (PgdA/CDA1 family)